MATTSRHIAVFLESGDSQLYPSYYHYQANKLQGHPMSPQTLHNYIINGQVSIISDFVYHQLNGCQGRPKCQLIHSKVVNMYGKATLKSKDLFHFVPFQSSFSPHIMTHLSHRVRDVKIGVQFASAWPQMGLFKISFSRFKKSIFVPFEAKLTQFGCQI